MTDDDRKDCGLRCDNGNCSCDDVLCIDVRDEICKGLQKAYISGVYDGIIDGQRAAEKALDTVLEEWKRDAERIQGNMNREYDVKTADDNKDECKRDADILFAPTCSFCGQVIHERVDCVKIESIDDCPPEWFIQPASCPYCHSQFESIKTQSKLPYIPTEDGYKLYRNGVVSDLDKAFETLTNMMQRAMGLEKNASVLGVPRDMFIRTIRKVRIMMIEKDSTLGVMHE